MGRHSVHGRDRGRTTSPCGAVSAPAVSLGLRHRCSPADKEKVKQARNDTRDYAARLVRDFTKQFGDITCRGLLGLDFSKPDEYQKFRESGIWKEKCEKHVQYTIGKLYEFEDDKTADEPGQSKSKHFPCLGGRSFSP